MIDNTAVRFKDHVPEAVANRRNRFTSIAVITVAESVAKNMLRPAASQFVRFPVKTLTPLNGIRWTRIEAKPSSKSHVECSINLFNIVRASLAFIREILRT